MDYLDLFATKNDKMTYKMNMNNLTVYKSVDELDMVNRQRQIGYLFQDDMIAYMTKSLSETQDKEINVESDNKSTGIEDFAPFKDFNKLLSAWTELGNLCSQYIDLYESNSNALTGSAATTLDADVIKQKLKDKVVLALNG